MKTDKKILLLLLAGLLVFAATVFVVNKIQQANYENYIHNYDNIVEICLVQGHTPNYCKSEANKRLGPH